MGNSEVGHLNLGAGTVVKQDLVRIDEAIEDGSFFENEALRAACAAARDAGGRLHLLGLVSAGGVHSSLDHLRACIELGARERVPALVLHAFTDGRDTLPDLVAGVPRAGRGLAGARRAAAGVPARIGTVMGRYWGMDRDRRWDRTQARLRRARARARGCARRPRRRRSKLAYGRGETDEFIQPTVDRRAGADPRRRQRRDVQLPARPDAPDRPRAGRGRTSRSSTGAALRACTLTTMTRYQEDWDYPVAFEEARPETTIAAVLAERGDRQLHVAETEKYAHVTYFFNGGEEDPYPGEERCLVPSPRDVPTYDLKPEMSAPEAAARVRRGTGARPPRRAAVPVRDHQLRQPRHGRPHRRASRPRRARSRRSTAASARCSRRCARPAARRS